MSKERSRNRAWLLAGLAVAAGFGIATLLDRPRVKLSKTTRILLVGDSLAQGLSPHLGNFAKESQYPYQAVHHVGSAIRYWTGERLAAALEQAKPTLAVVVLGTNDLAGQRSGEQLAADAAALLDQLSKFPRSDEGYCLGVDVLWVSPLVAMLAAHPQGEALEQAVRSPTGSCGKTEWFDSAVLDVKTGADGVHPVASGYAAWAGAIWKRLS